MARGQPLAVFEEDICDDGPIDVIWPLRPNDVGDLKRQKLPFILGC